MKKKNKLAIQLKNVTKTYHYRSHKPTLVENIFSRKKSEKYTALNSLDLTVNKGEKVGIVGSNGAGKTTLLKIISKITYPDHGDVNINGKIVSLINLYAGFHPELSGIENIRLNALLIGMRHDDVDKKTQSIVEFADIGKFIYAPFHTYSSGMRLRLGFSVAVHADPDILILDEGLSAGDERFQKKASKVIKKMFKKDKTIIVVSHWLAFLERNCERIIWLENGQIVKDGNIDIVSQYRKKSKRNRK